MFATIVNMFNIIQLQLLHERIFILKFFNKIFHKFRRLIVRFFE